MQDAALRFANINSCLLRTTPVYCASHLTHGLHGLQSSPPSSIRMIPYVLQCSAVGLVHGLVARGEGRWLRRTVTRGVTRHAGVWLGAAGEMCVHAACQAPAALQAGHSLRRHFFFHVLCPLHISPHAICAAEVGCWVMLQGGEALALAIVLSWIAIIAWAKFTVLDGDRQRLQVT